MDKLLNSHLEKYAVLYKEHKHPAFFTVKESQAYLFPFMRTKSLFLRDENNLFYLVCMDAHERLSMSKLKQHLSVKELEFANPEELLAHLRVTPGSVSIFALVHDSSVSLILDERIWSTSTSGFHPNENTSSLELTHENLEKFYNSLPNRKEILKLE